MWSWVTHITILSSWILTGTMAGLIGILTGEVLLPGQWDGVRAGMSAGIAGMVGMPDTTGAGVLVGIDGVLITALLTGIQTGAEDPMVIIGAATIAVTGMAGVMLCGTAMPDAQPLSQADAGWPMNQDS